MKHYFLTCLVCHKNIKDKNHTILKCTCRNSADGLLRPIYQNKQLELLPLPGIFKYANWLPVNIRALSKFNKSTIHPLTYSSYKLANALGISNITVSFNGYWPSRKTYYKTCSFKELEALTVLGRIDPNEDQTIVLASAGNTARAFHYYCSLYNIPAVIVVPQSSLSEIWTTLPASNAVKLIALDKDADYSDAIRLAEYINEIPGYFIEGGARNVARRDGLGTVILAGVLQTQQLPVHYFQAVGSGTGAIAVWEMSKRLKNDGRFGTNLPQLHLAQNHPYTPLTQAWNNNKSSVGKINVVKAKKQFKKLYAPVLSNRNPPYSLKGGLYEALKETNGKMYSITNSMASSATQLFYKAYNCDLDPAAAVALAALKNAIKQGAIKQEESVLINLTGGGKATLKKKIRYIKPDHIVNFDKITPKVLSKLLLLTKTKQRVKL